MRVRSNNVLRRLLAYPAHPFLNTNAIPDCLALVGTGTGLDDDIVQIVCFRCVPPASLPVLGHPDYRPLTDRQDLAINLEFARAFDAPRGECEKN